MAGGSQGLEAAAAQHTHAWGSTASQLVLVSATWHRATGTEVPKTGRVTAAVGSIYTLLVSLPAVCMDAC